MKSRNKKSLEEIKEGKFVEINGYPYEYIGRKIGKEKPIVGMECFVYISHELKEKNQPCEKWFIVNKTATHEVSIINKRYVW